MNRMSTTPRWPAALLGALLAGSVLLPVLAAPQDPPDRRAERWQRRAQQEAPSPAPVERTPAPPALPSPRPAAPSAPAPRRFEPTLPPAMPSRGSDMQRREDWGEQARQQQERQRHERPRDLPGGRIDTPSTDDPAPRPRFERPQARPQAPTDDARERAAWRQPQREALPPPQSQAASPQAEVIARAREEDARRQREQGRRDDARPDWRGDDDRGRGRDWREDRGDRVSREQQRERFETARRQQAQWQREEDRRRSAYERHRHDLERQRRHAQYRYQQDYWRRWLAAQARWSDYYFDARDPFFYTPYNYRYGYDGRWYSTNRYGAELLRQAVRDGYREGWYAGQADRADRWRFDYRNNYGWLDGSYGYYGQYVSLGDYRYYFRQGFERGYSDGYYGRYKYGRYENGDAMILPALLGLILAFTID